MSAPTVTSSTREALAKARDAVEELAHDAVERWEKEVPVLAGKLLDESGERITAARRELAAKLDPGPPPSSARRWWWIGAGVLVTVASVVGWIVLSRRPQQVELAEPLGTPPGDADLEVDEPAGATRNGHS